MNILVSPKRLGETRLKSFLDNCKKPQAWLSIGSEDRNEVINLTCEFLREAEKLAEEFTELDHAVYNDPTVDPVLSVLPLKLIDKIMKMDKATRDSPKALLKLFKETVEEESKAALNETAFRTAIKESSASYNTCVNT